MKYDYSLIGKFRELLNISYSPECGLLKTLINYYQNYLTSSFQKGFCHTV